MTWELVNIIITIIITCIIIVIIIIIHVPLQTIPEAPDGGGEAVTNPFILLIIQDFKLRMFAYTVGFKGAAQGRPPQLVAPSRYHLPLNSHTSGPPLSPLQAPWPPWAFPMHIMESSMLPG